MQGWYAEYCENTGGSESDLFWDIEIRALPLLKRILNNILIMKVKKITFLNPFKS